MRIYIGFDDTDIAGADRGTGKLARWFERKLPSECTLWGVVRQQLPRFNGIPYTSNNSSACVIVNTDIPEMKKIIIEKATDHIRELFIEGSDPGLCVVTQENSSIPELIEFGRICCSRIATQKEAVAVCRKVHLSGHGGTNDGIIGAAAGVGLTLSGWSGRFVEFGRLREYPKDVPVQEFEKNGIKVISIDRNALVPWHDHIVETYDWIRPRLWGYRPILPVTQVSENRWQVVGKKSEPPETH